MKGTATPSPKLKSMRPLERAYLDALQRRDLDEKRAFKYIYEDFAKYNWEILNMKNKNNELQVRIASSGGANSFPAGPKPITD